MNALLGLLMLGGLLAPRTAAIVMGHPHAPNEASLGTVRSDVLHMQWLFELLGAERTIVLHPAGGQAATLPALKAAVADLQDWAADAEAQVYVYYAGHGQRLMRSGTPTTQIFLPDGRGGTRRLDGRGLADHVLRPLSAVADVHFVADACQSFNLLSIRGRKRKRTAKALRATDDEVLREFFRALPKVGAALATNGALSTFEDPRSGGRFSYALRSVVLGWGDANQDSVITYRELDRALRLALAWAEDGPRDLPPPDPRIIGPNNRAEHAFASFVGRSDIAQVQVRAATRRRLRFYVEQLHRPVAVLHLPAGGQSMMHLARGQRYIVEDADTHEKWRFRAQDAPLSTLIEPAEGGWRARAVARGIATTPFDPRILATQVPPPLRANTQPLSAYFALSVQGGRRWYPGGFLGADSLPTVAFEVRAGRARHQWMVDFETSLAVSAGDGAGAERLAYDLQTHRLRAGYLGLLALDPVELGVGARIGGGILEQAIARAEQTNTSYLMTATAQVEAIWPIPGLTWLGLKLEAGAGAQAHCARGCNPEGVDFDPELTTRIGLEVEVTAL